jgi:hypothetical protein
MLFKIRVALVVSMLGSFLLLAEAQERPVEHPTFYRTTQIDGLTIFIERPAEKTADEIAALIRGFVGSSPRQADID